MRGGGGRGNQINDFEGWEVDIMHKLQSIQHQRFLSSSNLLVLPAYPSNIQELH